MKKTTNVVTEAAPKSRYSELKRMLEDRRREIQAEVQGKMRDVRAEGLDPESEEGAEHVFFPTCRGR